jgi:hypothetical protein
MALAYANRLRRASTYRSSVMPRAYSIVERNGGESSSMLATTRSRPIA